MKSVARNVIYEKRHKKHKKRAGSTLKCMHDILFDADAWGADGEAYDFRGLQGRVRR